MLDAEAKGMLRLYLKLGNLLARLKLKSEAKQGCWRELTHEFNRFLKFHNTR